MGNDFYSAVRPSLVLTLCFAVLLGIIYPLALWGVGQLAFPFQANGSLVRKDGVVIGSTVIGQAFTSDRYFQTRPSAAGKGYDGLASSGSNLGPTSQALVDRIKGDLKKQRDQGVSGPLPADLITASGSGLDPDLSPDAALIQVPRIAKARNLPEARVRRLVEQSIDQPLLGFIGEPHANLFELNRQLDGIVANSAR